MIAILQNALLYVLPFLIVLGIVVTVHESGHFLAAKWLGTKIDRFAIGFGHAIAHWTDKDGVEWRIGWLPLGGYVRFAGDDNAASLPDSSDLEDLRASIVAREGEGAVTRYFHFKPLWQRAIIVAAGPVSNFILATAVFAALLMAVGEPRAPARVEGVTPNSPAARAGFLPGDVVTEVNGRRIRYFEDARQVIILHSGVPLEFTVDRAGHELKLVGAPERGPVPDALGKVHQLGKMGIEFTRIRPAQYRYGPVEAIGAGAARCYDVVETTITYLGRMITGREKADQISGPLGMAQVAGGLSKASAAASPDAGAFAINTLLTILSLVANISVGIGFLNLLPIPVLDGGHLLFYAYEAIARRPLAAKVQAAGYRLGLALVLGLMLFATWNDLQRLRVFNFLGGLFS